MRFTAPVCLVILAASLPTAGFAQNSDPLGALTSVRNISNRFVAVGEYNDSLICASTDQITAWTRVRLPHSIHCARVVGGSPTSIMILTLDARGGDGDPNFPVYDLQSVDKDGTLTKRASKVGEICDFFNDQIGCQILNASATDASLLLTHDGGHTWRAAPYPFSAARNQVCSLKWLSASNLIVAERQKFGVSLFEIGQHDSKLLWHANLDSCAIQFEPWDEKSVFVRTYGGVLRLSLQDGRVLARLNSGLQNVAGVAAGVNQLFIWGGQKLNGANIEQLMDAALADKGSALAVWDWDGVEFRPEALRDTAHLAGVVTLKGKPALVFSKGSIGLLQGKQIVEQTAAINDIGPAASQPVDTPAVAPAPSEQPLPADWLPTEEEQMEEVKWARQVSEQDMNHVITGVDRNLSPRLQCIWVTDQCKQIVAARSK